MTPDAGIALAADPCDWSALAVAATTLPGGVRLLLVENHSVPLVFLSWTSPAGFECDPLGLEGIASLTPLLFREGSARRSAGQIAQQLDDLGAELASGSEWEGASLNLGLLSSDLFTGVELLLDMATTARFPDAAIARVRQRRLAEIEGRRRDPRAQANDELARALFGSTMYGRPPLGTVASVERIDADAIAAFHDARYRPDTSCLVIAGDVDGETALDRLATIASPRTTADRDTPDPLPSAAAIGIDPAEGLRTVHVAHATQTEIRVGHASVGRDSEDLPALDVLGTILGGGPTSRRATPTSAGGLDLSRPQPLHRPSSRRHVRGRNARRARCDGEGARGHPRGDCAPLRGARVRGRDRTGAAVAVSRGAPALSGSYWYGIDAWGDGVAWRSGASA
jgi:zinc protease